MIRTSLLLTALLVSVSGVVFAQELPALTHYTDANGRFFWPRSKALYLFVDDDPAGADANLLKSKSTPQYADPLYLSKEGLNLIRSKWAVQNGQTVQPRQEVIFEVYADGVPPVTKVIFDAPKYQRNGQVFYGKTLQIGMQSRDTTSGVSAILYAFDQDSLISYREKLNLEYERAYSLRVLALDWVNNAEKAQSFEFETDYTAPVTEFKLAGEFRGRVLSPRAQVELEAMDRRSGVQNIFYKIDSGKYQPYTSPIQMDGLSDGTHTLYYYAVDYVKNTETVKSLEFYLDKLPPEVTVNIIGDQYQNRGRVFISDRTNVEFVATDNRSGLKRIVYQVDNDEEKIYREPFLLEKGQGSHVIKYYAVDEVGNGINGEWKEEYGGRKGLDMDMEAPAISYAYTGKTWKSRDTTFITGATQIALTATDNETGIKKVGYKINGGLGKEYQTPFLIAEAGVYKVDYYATDNVNNRNTADFYLVVDNDGPVVSHSFSARASRTHTHEGQVLPVYSRGVRLYLSATDTTTDVQEIYYQVGTAAQVVYSQPVVLSQPGLNRIRISAIDRLGNITTEPKELAFWVE